MIFGLWGFWGFDEVRGSSLESWLSACRPDVIIRSYGFTGRNSWTKNRERPVNNLTIVKVYRHIPVGTNENVPIIKFCSKSMVASEQDL